VRTAEFASRPRMAHRWNQCRLLPAGRHIRQPDSDANMQGMGSAHGFWELLTGDEQRDLMALGQGKKYPPGTTLCVEGDPATPVFVLLDGWVKILSVTGDR